MANKRSYKSNKNIVYSCKYHVVWIPKYRRKVLVRGVDVRLKEIVYEVTDELQREIIELEVMCDHVHMFCEVDPQLGIHRFVKRVKGKSSRMLRQEFDELRSCLPTLPEYPFVVVLGRHFTPEFVWSGGIYALTRYPETLSRLGLCFSRFRRLCMTAASGEASHRTCLHKSKVLACRLP